MDIEPAQRFVCPCVNVLTTAELNKVMFVFQIESTGLCFHFFVLTQL